MSIDLSQFHQVFFEEAAEHLETMEQLLLRLDVDHPDADALNAIFRAAHSIKGGAGTFGFSDLAEVTHILETLLDRIRNNQLALRAEMVDEFLCAGDVLRAQLAGHREGAAVDPQPASDIMASLQQLSATPPAQPFSADEASIATVRRPLRIVFTPAHPSDALADNLHRELALLDEEITFSTQDLQDGRRQYCYLMQTAASLQTLREMLDFVAQPDEVAIHDDSDPGYGLFDDAHAASEDFGLFEDAPGAVAESAYGFFAPLPEPAAAEPARAHRATARTQEKSGTGDSSIRVSVDKVDQMINLVGELVITQAMLAQTVAQLDPALHERLLQGMAQLERNTRDLQESVMSVRMMPMSSVFSRFPRMVRDLAGKLGKDIELVTEGENTELDKSLIEKIVDPLTHLVRNSLDHGIETPEKRQAAGKPRRGTLVLRAAHQGGNIVIEVEDNGGGLNRAKLLAKASEKGLPVSESMSDQEVWQIIFTPGFSTAEAVTDVSGRGVGMDVVKRNIDALGGRIEIASNPGQGTRVAIRLPLTLAILDGMSVAVGNEVFIIPLTYIAESLQPAAADIRSVTGQGKLVHVRGEYLPLLSLYRVFNFAPRTSDPTQGILVIVESGAGRVALFVDDLLGQHQVVIKSLEANYRRVEGIAGATIMGDGRVALILDVTALISTTHAMTGEIA